MDASNLAICIGPNVLSPENEHNLSLEARRDLNDKVCAQLFLRNSTSACHSQAVRSAVAPGPLSGCTHWMRPGKARSSYETEDVMPISPPPFPEWKGPFTLLFFVHHALSVQLPIRATPLMNILVTLIHFLNLQS